MVIIMNYGKKLKELREESSISQKTIADSIGIERSSYNQFEQQYDIIPINRLNQIANYFNTSIDFILDLTNNKNYENSKQDLDINISKVRLKEFRKENNLTQEKLAKFLQASQSTIAYFEKGRNLIATPFLYEICKKYNISADYLLGKIDEPKYLN